MVVGAVSFLMMLGVKVTSTNYRKKVKTEIKNLSLMLVQALSGISLDIQDVHERIQEDTAPRSDPSFEQG